MQMDVTNADLRPSKLYGSLDPFSPPLGLDPRSCSTEETTFIVKAGTLTQTPEVTDMNQINVVLCETKLMSPSKSIKHPGTGQTLFTIDKRRSDRSERGTDPAGREAFEVRKQTNNGVIKIVISFLNVSTARPVELVFQSDDRSNARGQVLLGTRTVGWVSREYKTLSSTPLFMTLAPGVDLALMGAVSTCLSGLFTPRDMTSNSLASTMAQ